MKLLEKMSQEAQSAYVRSDDYCCDCHHEWDFAYQAGFRAARDMIANEGQAIAMNWTDQNGVFHSEKWTKFNKWLFDFGESEVE